MERERERERKRETTRKKEKGGEREREKEKETHIHLAKERQIETERYNRDLSCCSPRVDHPEVEATTCLKIQQPRKPKENKQFIILHNHRDSICLMLISKNRITGLVRFLCHFYLTDCILFGGDSVEIS